MRTKAMLITISWLAGLLVAAAWLHPSATPTPFTSEADSTSQITCASVVVNEVAWAGTIADATDEWIELANTSPVTIDLDGWRLYAADGSPDLDLSGQIAPYGYFLIERTADTTVADVAADLIATFGTGLENTGEQLELRDAAGHLIDTVNADGTTWPNSPGLMFPYPSMERVTPAAPDTASSWVSNNGSALNGTDADGNPIYGTPRAPNSSYLVRYGNQPDLVVRLSGSEAMGTGYVASATLTLSNRGGVTATAAHVTTTLHSALSAIIDDQVTHTITLSGQAMDWLVGDLAPGHTTHFTFQVRQDLTTTTPLTTVARASSGSEDLNSCDNTAAWVVLPANKASVALSLSGPPVLIGSSVFSYYLRVTNSGAVDLVNVTLDTILPDKLTYVGQVSPFPIHDTPPTLTWHLGFVPAQASRAVTAIVQLDESFGPSGLLTNTARVIAETPGGMRLDDTQIWVTQVGGPRVVMGALLYDGYQVDDADEAIELVNAGTSREETVGWELCKTNGSSYTCADLPTFALDSGERVWLTRDATSFRTSFGFEADITLAEMPQLPNDGAAIMLRAPNDRYMDTLVYKSGETHVPGWAGPALLPYRNGVAPETGQILTRRRDEATGLPLADTDTALDWIQDATDPVLGRRVSYPGWDIDSLSRPLSVTESATLIAGIAPDTAFEVIAKLLLDAHHTISIEVYSLRHPAIAELLAARARSGVSVSVLVEGTPVGVGALSPEWQTQLYACQQIELAGGACWFMAHEPADHVYNRYPYIHAKLLIVDDTWVAIGSQNLTPSGLPSDDKSNGTAGTRGVVLVTDAPSIVEHTCRIFALDLDPRNHTDLVRWNTRYTERYGEPILNLVEWTVPDSISYTVRFGHPFSLTGRFGFELFTAPEAALRRSDALFGLLERAGKGDRVWVEQLYEHQAWGADPEADPNLRLRAYIDAARRGASVRILLNGRSFVADNPLPPEENVLTVQSINALAAREHLDLRATTGAPTGDAIHNKMVLVNLVADGHYVHVGSLNGSETASKLNREIALQVKSRQLYEYLERLFEYDWSVSSPIYLPVVTAQYVALPRADHLLISEVAYATASAASEWVELYNPTDQDLDLSTYRLGDAESPTAWEPVFRFPPGATLPAGGVMVIAVNASQVSAADFEFYESTPLVPNMQVDPTWGSTDYPFALRDLGDQVVLLGSDNQIVDAVVWGDRELPGTVPHPGVGVNGASLERYPAKVDTDNCTVDFRERYPPTPRIIEDSR